jgi:hypothetical protein
MMSSSCVSGKTPSQLPVKALSTTFRIPHFDHINDYIKLMTLWMSWTPWSNKVLIPLFTLSYVWLCPTM